MSRIYLASSWRNPRQPGAVKELRAAGHEVYDFRNPAPGNDGFSWSAIDPHWLSWTPEQFRRALEHPIALDGFGHDMRALEACDTCVLLLPCGRSAHLEAGWAAGAGRRVLVLAEGLHEPELMYLMNGDAGAICLDMAELLERLEGDDVVTLTPEGERVADLLLRGVPTSAPTPQPEGVTAADSTASPEAVVRVSTHPKAGAGQ